MANLRASAAASNPAALPYRFTCYLCLNQVDSAGPPKRVNGRPCCIGCLHPDAQKVAPPAPVQLAAALGPVSFTEMDPDERRSFPGARLALAGAW